MIVDRLRSPLAGSEHHGRTGPFAAAIGSFDGVHGGHRYLLDRMAGAAGQSGLSTLVVTFEPLPFETLHHPQGPSRRLTDLDERLRFLTNLGIDRTAVVDFTAVVAHLPPDDFLRSLLRWYEIRQLWCGEDFAFGHKRQGDVAFLRRRGPVFGFTVQVTPRMDLDGHPLASRVIRDLIAAGDVESASRLLDHLPVVSGTVVRGAARGRELGYPTANLAVPAFKLIPKSGVYAGFADLDGERHVAAISVGHNPTFGSNPLGVEGYLLDFDRDIYDRRLTYEFARRLRDEIKFDSVEPLISQMGVDVATTRRLLQP